MDNSKPFYQSKTFWASVLTSAAPFIPGVAPIIAAHPDYIMTALGGLFLLLRTVTKGAVSVT